MDDGTSDFTDLTLPRLIDTSSVDFVKEFYVPLLSRSVEYKRGVGYFTTNWIRSAARGITDLAENGGQAKWLTSPKLTEDDWEAIKRGNEARTNEVLRETLEKIVNNLRYNLEYDTRNAVAWMIADELLELKFGIPTEELSGDFHDKFGVFYDQNNNRVSFHGSKNDSEHAFTNYEAYTVDCDWLSARDEEGVSGQEERFDRLWYDNDPNVDTYTLPEGIEKEIAELRDTENRPYDDPNAASSAKGVEDGDEITLRPYQQDAVNAWFNNRCRGLLQMATGTGKTFTALAALEDYIEGQSDPVLAVIAVPFKHLAPQWAEEMETFGLERPRFLYGSVNPDWKRDLSKVVSKLELGQSDQEIVITTHKTLSSEYFREKVQNVTGSLVLLGDEVHHQGSEEYRKGLMTEFDARLGLSATPERHYDEEGSAFLVRYFEGIVFEYSLEDAIPEYLTPYIYNPRIVVMTEDELEEYRELTPKVAAAMSNEEIDEEVESQLLNKRAEIVKSAENKYSELQNLLSEEIENPDHLLVYTNSDQLNEVQSILTDHDILQHKFTYKEGDDTREELLDGFEKGRYDALVAMKCLDEGVDVTPTRQAILMSNSGNPMQFIQRRGRVLRQAEGKDKATIYDMIVVPARDPDEELRKSEKNILEKELRRVEEFAENALNEFEARNVIEDIRFSYRL
jgi:superfamily II DNA or RNA helicase